MKLIIVGLVALTLLVESYLAFQEVDSATGSVNGLGNLDESLRALPALPGKNLEVSKARITDSNGSNLLNPPEPSDTQYPGFTKLGKYCE
jgi:hypothetical protein